MKYKLDEIDDELDDLFGVNKKYNDEEVIINYVKSVTSKHYDNKSKHILLLNSPINIFNSSFYEYLLDVFGV